MMVVCPRVLLLHDGGLSPGSPEGGLSPGSHRVLRFSEGGLSPGSPGSHPGSQVLARFSRVESGLDPPQQFNALHNRSALKVDFYRVAGDECEYERFRRRRRVTLFDHPAWIAAPEDVLLHKLRWHKISPSDRQLTDARGIFLVSGDELDRDYMNHWAKQIGVSDLLRLTLDG